MHFFLQNQRFLARLLHWLELRWQFVGVFGLCFYEQTLAELARQQSPHSVRWCRDSTGQLLVVVSWLELNQQSGSFGVWLKLGLWLSVWASQIRAKPVVALLYRRGWQRCSFVFTQDSLVVMVMHVCRRSEGSREIRTGAELLQVPFLVLRHDV